MININRDQAPNHALWIEDRRTKFKRKLMTYNRHVDVGWSPTSQHIFINDYAESNEADCILFDVKARQILSVSALLRDQFQAWGIAGVGHRYVRCTTWQQSSVAVTIMAYGTAKPSGFERRIILDPLTRRVISVR
ncbi:hypothetical protein [Sphingomonas sp.]|uniref:hypothetical protein n=1 Tax=Sphingomonas sp. TaxID=28214 RepID=UPI0025E3C583|nr:hypothetical protein [Sphingomonas sp.]